MNRLRYIFNATALVMAALLTACSTDFDEQNYFNNWMSGMMGGSGSATDDTDAPGFDKVIHEYNGEMATDAANDTVGTDADFFHEANNFSTIVDVHFDGNNADVSCNSDSILSHVCGAHVVIDLQTNSVKDVNIRLSGKPTTVR